MIPADRRGRRRRVTALSPPANRCACPGSDPAGGYKTGAVRPKPHSKGRNSVTTTNSAANPSPEAPPRAASSALRHILAAIMARPACLPAAAAACVLLALTASAAAPVPWEQRGKTPVANQGVCGCRPAVLPLVPCAAAPPGCPAPQHTHPVISRQPLLAHCRLWIPDPVLRRCHVGPA